MEHKNKIQKPLFVKAYSILLIVTLALIVLRTFISQISLSLILVFAGSLVMIIGYYELRYEEYFQIIPFLRTKTKQGTKADGSIKLVIGILSIVIGIILLLLF